MTKTYRDWSTDQTYLFPPSPHDWLPEGDLVYFLLDTVATLDLSPIFAHYERELRGQPPFHPRMMVALLLYCYATGTRSSRRIMRRCHVDVACRVIVGEDIPDFRTISDFRKIHLARLEALFVEVLKLCALAGSGQGRHHRPGWDQGQGQRLAAQGHELRPDEDRRGRGSRRRSPSSWPRPRPPMRPRTPTRPRPSRRRTARRVGSASEPPGEDPGGKGLLEERARIEAAEEAARRQAEGKSPPATPPAEAVPDPKDQINFTDPESRIMKASNKGWDQCGNAQAVTNEHQIILAADVTDQANDVRQAVPMVDQTRANLDAAGVKEAIKAALGDAGYYSETNATDLEQRGIEPYLATERLKHHEKVASAPRGRIPKGLSAKQRMARKLRTKKGREMYAKRKGMIEPIFGQLKQVLGFRQFSMRGLASMRGEWRLMATVHNLLKLWRNDQKMEMAG